MVSNVINDTAKKIFEPVVVIPVHSQFPTKDEQWSLRRCGLVLSKHQICIVHPSGLNIDAYLSLIPQAKLVHVPPAWMESKRAYNRMLINSNFFRIFDAYSHLLIHEPDALVVSDCLTDWCEAGFDFIGAPLFLGYAKALPNAPFNGELNSGFSLFCIETTIRFLDSRFRWYKYRNAIYHLLRRLLRRPCDGITIAYAMRGLGEPGLIKGAYKLTNLNCDLFLCRFASKVSPRYVLPKPEEATRFSWDAMPERCHQLNNGKLPFGIHAWARYNRGFIENFVVSTFSK